MSRFKEKLNILASQRFTIGLQNHRMFLFAKRWRIRSKKKLVFKDLGEIFIPTTKIFKDLKKIRLLNFRRNYVRLNMFYGKLNFENFVEQPVYTVKKNIKY